MMAYIAFSAQGGRLNGFRDGLRQCGIACRGQQIRGERYYARTAIWNRRRIQRLAAEYGVTVEILERHGMIYRMLPYCKRIGILVGLMLGGMFVYWCNATVRSIEITGNETIPDAEILRALSVLDVERGSYFREIPYNYVEQRMRLLIRDIEWITLRQLGGRLIVDLTEERAIPEMVDDRIPTNYVATVPAQITKINVLGGYAMKQVGETVKAGEILISGVYEDRRGISRYYHGDGVVEGIYTTEFVVEQPYVTELPVHGERMTETVLELFGKRISLSKGFTPPADETEWCYEEQRVPLMLFGHVLPLNRIDCHYAKNETAVTAWSEAEAKAVLEEAALRYERNFHQRDVLIERKPEFCITDLGISLKIDYVFEGVIGKPSEIYVKLS